MAAGGEGGIGLGEGLAVEGGLREWPGDADVGGGA